MENSKAKLSIDVNVPTDRDLTAMYIERRPDLIVYDRYKKRISILKVAVAGSL